MAHTALTPVFVGLRTGLHVLFATLVALVVVRALVEPTAALPVILALATLLATTYALGATLAGRTGLDNRGMRLLWLAALAAEWGALVWLTPEAAYLVFPLFFLFLHFLGPQWGSLAVGAATAAAITALGVHGGWSVGGVVGPLVGAGVALLIGLGYRALAREAAQREALVAELIATRDQLAKTERESGALAERSRLAREIHDTLAQGLSSIQMLLHAAEFAAPDRAGVEHIQLARETAAANLADARRFVRELTPPALEGDGLGSALRRLASTQWAQQGIEVRIRVSDTLGLPMDVQTALLRIAQGAVANALQHAQATRVTIGLAMDDAHLRFAVEDDGRGFDLEKADEDNARSDSFGLRATRERVDQLGGTLTLDSAPGRGTSLVVELSLRADA